MGNVKNDETEGDVEIITFKAVTSQPRSQNGKSEYLEACFVAGLCKRKKAPKTVLGIDGKVYQTMGGFEYTFNPDRLSEAQWEKLRSITEKLSAKKEENQADGSS
jgi:hypothetical protein